MNPLAHWKSTLITLPDSVFFDLMRNYLGELKTPFNKHRLVQELSAFLSRRETVERIIALIDEEDARVLTAVHLMERPKPEDLLAFFEGDQSYLDLHRRLLNLEERLLVYRDRDSGVLAVNPILKDDVVARRVSESLVLPHREVDEPEAPLPWLNDALAGAVLAFLLRNPDLLKTDGSLRKKAAAELSRRFPVLMDYEGSARRFHLLLNALRALELVSTPGGACVPTLRRWRELAAMDVKERRLLLWGAAAAVGIDDAHRRASIVACLLGSLPTRRAYPDAALQKLAVLCDRHGALDVGGGPAELVGALLSLDLLVRVDTENATRNPHTTEVPAQGADDEPVVVVQPNFAITVKGWISLSDAVDLAHIADVVRHDLYPHFELTKESYMRGLSAGMTEERVRTILERLSGQRLPQNVAFSLTTWEREYRSIGFYEGTVMVVSEDRRHLVEHSEELQQLVRRVLAPGIYLLDPRDEPLWRGALQHAGVDPVPDVQRPNRDVPPIEHQWEPIPAPEIAGGSVPGGPAVEPAASLDGHTVVAELQSHLAGLSLPRDQKEELAQRIEKRLILFPHQLGPGVTRQEKTEAKGLDFLGKVRLIEQALGSQSDLLEIIERTADGEPRRILVRPMRLDRNGNTLTLFAQTQPDGAEERVNVSKVVLLRKLKGSIFAP
jgi:hypothetical protein